MIEFLKILLSKVNFKTKDENLNKYNKIIYSVICICAVIFVIIIIYFFIKLLPNFMDGFQTNWNNYKTNLKLRS